VIYSIPRLEDVDFGVIRLIHDQRMQLKHNINQSPVRWKGFLRRNTFARALQGSNSIEGINASLDEAIAIIDDEKPETVEDETRAALLGYRNAMTYILRAFEDPHFELHPQVIKSIHFMMLHYDLTKGPGQWRTGSIFIVRQPSNETVYEGPDAELIPGLIVELVRQLTAAENVDSMVLAAMAHLNLAMIHPFKDGNGRMARALQTLVLAQEGVLSPVFCSIEEWLGRNTQAYYQILGDTGRGGWNPGNDALPWVRFCLRAHHQQGATLIRRNKEIGEVWEAIDKIIRENELPPRTEWALMDAAFGSSVRNAPYRTEVEVSEVVASRDLRRLCDLDLLIPVGEKRGRYYRATKKLEAIRARHRHNKGLSDPYELEAARRSGNQLLLPSL
jgi:Fic family protein